MNPLAYDSIRLVAIQPAITCSRLFVSHTLTRWTGAAPPPAIERRAVQLVDELATEAVKATGTMDAGWKEHAQLNFLAVRLLAFKESLVVEVVDTSPELPTQPHEPGSAVKRGCYAVQGGRAVWGELLLLPARTPRPQPPVPAEQFGQTREPYLLRRVREGLEGL